jgi:exonuclease VII small subunit
MEDDIAAFEDEITSLEDCVTDLEDNVTELESTVAEQEDDASAAKVLQYALIAVIGVLALAVVLLLVQNSKLRKGRGPQGPG